MTTYVFYLLHADISPTPMPKIFRVEASSADAAVRSVAKHNGWRLTEWDGEMAWYEIGGRDFGYEVSEEG